MRLKRPRRRPVPALVREIARNLADAGFTVMIGQQFGDASLVVKSGRRHVALRVEHHNDVRFEIVS